MAPARDVRHADGHSTEMAFGRRRVVPDLGVVAFDECDPARSEVAPDRSQQADSDLLGRVDQRAHEEHTTERAPEIEILDAREDLLGALDQLQHFRVEVDCHHAATHREKWMSDAARSRAELEDLGVIRNLAVDELRLVGCREKPIQVDGRAWVAHSRRVWQTAVRRATTYEA